MKKHQNNELSPNEMTGRFFRDERVARLAHPDPVVALQAAREVALSRRKGVDCSAVMAELRGWLGGNAAQLHKLARVAHLALTDAEARAFLDDLPQVLHHSDPELRAEGLAVLGALLALMDASEARTLWDTSFLPVVDAALSSPRCWRNAVGLLERAAKRGWPLGTIPSRILSGGIETDRALNVLRYTVQSGQDISGALDAVSGLIARHPTDRLVAEVWVRGWVKRSGWPAIEELLQHTSAVVRSEVLVIGAELVHDEIRQARERKDKAALKLWFVRKRSLKSAPSSARSSSLMRLPLKRAFDRIFLAAEDLGVSVWAPAIPGPQEQLWTSAVSDDGMVAWQPKLKRERNTLEDIEQVVGHALPVGVISWFNAWWFLGLEGQLDGRVVSLRPVVPGAELDDLRGFCVHVRARLGRVPYLPMGNDPFGSGRLVVHALEGSVWWEDGGTLTWAGADLADVVNRLVPILSTVVDEPAELPPMREVLQISAFRELPHGDPDGPSLKDAVRTGPATHASRLLRWLERGEACAISPGVVSDVLDPSLGIVGTGSILTDGTFAWSDDLAHYVRRHHVVVPQAFLEHCAAHDWQFPMTVDVEDLSIVPLRGE